MEVPHPREKFAPRRREEAGKEGPGVRNGGPDLGKSKASRKPPPGAEVPT